jgi:capsular polysaccharide biosynthesis protein
VSAVRRYVSAASRRNPAVRAAVKRVLKLRNVRLPGRPGVPLQRFRGLLPGKHPRKVVIITAAQAGDALLPWLQEFQADRIHILAAAPAAAWRQPGIAFTHHTAATIEQYVEVLKPIGPVHVIVDLIPVPAGRHQKLWEALFYHLTPGGLYLVDPKMMPAAERQTGIERWSHRFARSDATGAGQPALSDRDAEFLASTARAIRTRNLLLVKKRHRHHLKVRDAEANTLVPAREPKISVTELQTLPAGELVSKAEVVSHESGVPIQWLPERMSYPEMHLRHYEGRVAFAGRSLVYTDTCVLPETFRWHLEPNPRVVKVKSTSPLFIRLPPRVRPHRTLAGTYFHMDPNGTGHFGHFLTESISRLWGWDEAKRRYPDLKALYRIRDISKVNERFERRLMTAFGIDAGDIVAVDEPVYVNSLVTATTMWHNADPHYVHPALTEVWDRITRNLADPAAPTYDRVFVSRTSVWRRRGCQNIGEVERFFEEHGFTVIYPEDLDLATQAAIFATTPVIAGFAGSAMFNIMHSKNLKTLILLGHEAYTARNEHLYSSLIGGPVHYFWSRPEVPHPVGGWSQRAFDSDWEFDFARNRKPLEELFDSL